MTLWKTKDTDPMCKGWGYDEDTVWDLVVNTLTQVVGERWGKMVSQCPTY